MKKIFLITLMSLITVLMAGKVSATAPAPTCDFVQVQTTAGTSSSYIRGTAQVLNVTITYGAGTNTSDNVTLVRITASPGTITGTLLSNTTDGTNNTKMNVTVNTKQLKDDITQTFTMTMYNETQASLGTCTETYISDNTVPVVTLSTPTDKSKDTDGTVTFTYTCTNASSATLYAEGVGSYTSYTMTESSDSCTYSNLKLLTNGFHSHYAITSDGLNTTTSSVSTIEVRRPGGYIYDEQGQIMTDTAGATVPAEGNIVTNTVDKLFSFIFGIFDSIFSIFK